MPAWGSLSVTQRTLVGSGLATGRKGQELLQVSSTFLMVFTWKTVITFTYMYKTLILALALLIPAAWLQAQDNMGKSGASEPTTITGCLSNHNGQYWLKDSSGTVYPLSSNAQKLQGQVGHEVGNLLQRVLE